jgi:hypothetical protein
MRLGKFDLLPDRRFCAGISDYRDKDGQSAEEYFLCVRLPSYGYGWDMATETMGWYQRVLCIGLNTGFRILHRHLTHDVTATEVRNAS